MNSTHEIYQPLTNEEKLEYKTRLLSLCSEANICLSDDQAALLINYLDLALTKNNQVNLTSIRDFDKGLVLHLFDSLLFVKAIDGLDNKDAKRLLDMGSGGGFPGIPIAICTDLNVILLDSVNKKVTACNEFVEALDIQDQTHAESDRLESFAKSHRREFDVITARALATLDILLEYSEPLIKMNGYLVLGKANPTSEELTDAQKVAEMCGFENVSRETFDLPENFGHRELYIYKKVSQSRVKLPRRNGEAKKNPLAYK